MIRRSCASVVLFAAVLVLAATASAETIVSDTIRTQTWTKAGSPYRIVAITVLPAGETLTIEPAVEVNFARTGPYDSPVRIIIQGRLIAIGTAAETVSFQPDPTASVAPAQRGWSGIHLSGTDSSTIRYARISGVTSEDSPMGGSALGMTGDVRVGLSHVRIESNSFQKGAGVGIGGNASATFDTCTIKDNWIFEDDGAGVWTSGTGRITFTGCDIVQNGGGNVGGAFRIQGDNHVSLVRCIVSGNSASEGDAFWSLGHLELDQVTVAGGNQAITVLGSLVARNCIFQGLIFTETYWWVYEGRRGTIDVAYSLVRGSISGEGNIDADPLFVDAANRDYHLSAGSPAIDAGDPASPLDPDGTRADLGAIPYDHNAPAAIAESRAFAFSLSPNAPNPFNPSTVIRFSLAQAGETKLAIYDVSGRHVRTLISGPLSPGAHEVAWDGRDSGGRRIGSGVYVCRLSANEGVLVRRMALVR